MKINHLLGARVIVQGIKGKIASRSIIAQGAVDIVTQNPPVLVGLMSLIRGRPKGRCLDHLAAKDHMHEVKAAANNKGTAKKRPNLFWGGSGGHARSLRRCATH